MSEPRDSNHREFATVLQEQEQRVIAALGSERTIDATPIVRDDETLSCTEYVTLVYELHHVHLPKLQTVGLIEFDRREDVVMRGPQFDQTHPLRSHDDDP